MKTLVGRTPVALARRWLQVERLAQITLRRDAYAAVPGPTVTLALGERTSYRPGAWLLDQFERAELGASYPAWGGSPGLTLTGGRVTAAVGPVGMAAHTATLPRDAWAAVTLAALSGPSAVAGVLLQAADDGSAYRITATPAGATVIERLGAGGPATLATVPGAWRPGDVLRVVLHWDRLRVYREPILVADVRDTGLALAGRRAGLVVGRTVAGDAAQLAHFVAGEARQEYLGAGLDLGDVSMVLGQPVTFDVTLSDVPPMGGKPRFAALLRHGLNTEGTYDLDRGTVRVLTVVNDGLAPLTAAVGWIDAPGPLSEDSARLQVRGRDAFLTPQLAAGPVTYLPGPPPGGLLPLPADPCAPATPPEIMAGPVPPEPPTSPPPEGIGPERPDTEITTYHYGHTYYEAFGHVGPGNNYVSDSEVNGAVTRYEVLTEPDYLVTNQKGFPVPLAPGHTLHNREALWYVWRSRPGGLGTHLKVTISGVYGGGVVDYGSGVTIWGLPYPPPASLVEFGWVHWQDVIDARNESATYLGKIKSAAGGFQPPEDTTEHPPTDFGPLVAEVPLPFETATILFIASCGEGHPPGSPAPEGTFTASIIDAEFTSPVPVMP